MPIDSSMYLQQQSPDIMGGLEQGLKMKDMLRQQKLNSQADAFNDQLRNSYIVGPDGKPQFDQSKMPDLYKANPQMAAQFQQQQKQQQLANLDLAGKKAEFAGRLAGTVSDQTTHDATIANLKGLGFTDQDLGSLGTTYDKSKWDKFASMADTHAQAVENHIKQQTADAATSQAATANQRLGIEDKKANASIEANNLKRNEMASDKQRQEFDKTRAVLESSRGDAEVTQALKDRYAAKKLDKIMGADPNNLSPQMVQMATAEAAKIAQGGVPQVDELRQMKTPTIPSALAAAAQMLTNAPSPANQGAFLKQYQDYARNIRSEANRVLYDKHGRVVEGAKAHLSQGDYEKLKELYPYGDEAAAPHPVDNMSDSDVVKAYKAMKGIQ